MEALYKLDHQQVIGVTRVIIWKSKNILFIITKLMSTITQLQAPAYSWGKTKTEDLSQQAQLATAEKFKFQSEDVSNIQENT